MACENFDIKLNVLNRIKTSFEALVACVKTYKNEIERIKTEIDQESIECENIFAAFTDEYAMILEDLIMAFNVILGYRKQTKCDDGTLVIRPVTEDSKYSELFYAHVSTSAFGEKRHPVRTIAKYDNVSVEQTENGYNFLIGYRTYFLCNVDYFVSKLDTPYNASNIIFELCELSKTAGYICQFLSINICNIKSYINNFNRLYS